MFYEIKFTWLQWVYTRKHVNVQTKDAVHLWTFTVLISEKTVGGQTSLSHSILPLYIKRHLKTAHHFILLLTDQRWIWTSSFFFLLLTLEVQNKTHNPISCFICYKYTSLTVSPSFCFLFVGNWLMPCYECKSEMGSCESKRVYCLSGSVCASITSTIRKLSLRVNQKCAFASGGL